MNIWPIQEAKAHFSELINTCLKEGAQIVSRRGKNTAVLLPIDDWERLFQVDKASLKELLLMQEGRDYFKLPKRGNAKRRVIPPI